MTEPTTEPTTAAPTTSTPKAAPPARALDSAAVTAAVLAQLTDEECLDDGFGSSVADTRRVLEAIVTSELVADFSYSLEVADPESFDYAFLVGRSTPECLYVYAFETDLAEHEARGRRFAQQVIDCALTMWATATAALAAAAARG